MTSSINRNFLAPCGLYCGVCGVYYATRDNNAKFMEKLLANYQRTMPGLENVHSRRPGYAIESDYFDRRGIKSCFEMRQIQGLFVAGQINVTTGYEEAAAQGLVSGTNAALQCRGEAAWPGSGTTASWPCTMPRARGTRPNETG